MPASHRMPAKVLDRLGLRDLLFFETIAEFSHLGRAARELGRTQPALTKSVRRLETAVGTRLFERVGRGIQITPCGLLLLKRVRVLRKLAEEALREVDDFEHGSSGRVRVGSGPVTAERLLPGVCRMLHSQGGLISIEVVVGFRDELLLSLRARNLDLVLGPLKESQDDLVSLPLIEDVFVVAARSRHEIFRKHKIKMQDLLAYRWVLETEQSASRQWIERTFELHGLPKPTVELEGNIISLLSSVIAESDLITFVSRELLRAGPAGVKLREVPLKETVMCRQLGVTWLKDAYLSPATLRLIESVNSGALDVISGGSPETLS